MTRVGVSLVVWHSTPETVLQLCRSLAESDQTIDGIWLHANDESDPAILLGWRSIVGPTLPLSLSSSEENLGYAGGHNKTLGEAFGPGACDYVLVVNPDVRLDVRAIETLIEFVSERQTPTLVGPLLERATDLDMSGIGLIDSAGIRWDRFGRQFDDLYDRPLADAPATPTRIHAVSGACLLVSRPAYERIVGLTGEFFDADFIAYREDAELGLRAGVVGIESWLVPAARGWHIRHIRGKHRGSDAHADRLGVRNRFLIAFKYGRRRPGGWLGPVARDIVVIAAVMVRERTSRAGLADAWSLRHKMRQKRARLSRLRARENG